MEQEYCRLASLIVQNASSNPKQRYLIAIAGVPGSGKTTVAGEVARRLNCMSPTQNATVVSMDGFHLDRATLDHLPNRNEAYIRRGAPWTFDVPHLVAFIRQLRTWADSDSLDSEGNSKRVLSAPGFDHQTKDPVPNAVPIAEETRIVIIEGNYLLLDEPEWREVAEMVDYRVFVKADLRDTRNRLAKRHLRSGIENTLADAFRRVDSNDYLNSLHVHEKLITPDAFVSSVTEANVNGF